MKYQETVLLLWARLLERAGFYGLRSMLILYMVTDLLHFEEQKAMDVYGYFMLGLFLSYVPGALLGDLLLGNKKASIVGGCLMALGAFSIGVPSPTGLYIGL